MRLGDEQVQRVPPCVICARGVPLDLLVELPSTWVTAAQDAPLPDYVSVVSKVHVIEPFELRGEARRAFWDDMSMVAEAVHRTTRSTKLNYEIHGNTIPHLHLHLYPRFPGDPYQGAPIDPLIRLGRRPRGCGCIVITANAKD
jgi:diadenosine tetraphosphate (Ap4A) HIT family hydrolase